MTKPQKDQFISVELSGQACSEAFLNYVLASENEE
jgi:hypothetical protein